MLWTPEGFDIRMDYEGGDWLWPSADEGAWAAVHATLPDLQMAIDLCKRKRSVVQAGGNCGVWPKYLAKQFDTVYTFEPDPQNFLALVNNCPEPNIVKMQACLGYDSSPCALGVHDPRNSGAHFAAQVPGNFPVLELDDLKLEGVDLIVLDIEGLEGFALEGAYSTIESFKPVIQFENKHSERYGTPAGFVEKKLETWGYKTVARPHRDIIMVPA